MKKYDVVALGELLIDFTSSGEAEDRAPLFKANPGGAPCNVLAMLSGLGKKTAFIGKVGNDFFGKHLKMVLEELGICTCNLLLDEKYHTTLAFVHNHPDGDRDFIFYRDPGADMKLCAHEVQEELIVQSRIFHFGSLSLTHPGVREATKKALQIAKENSCLISFDPNLREPLWDRLDEARKQIAFGLSQCDILKISDNELQWFTDRLDLDEGVSFLQDIYRIKLILLSMGKNGSRAYYGGMKAEVKTFPLKNTIDTTGAGDTFCACALNYILEHNLENLSYEDLLSMLTFANAAASLITTRKGALRVMPKKEEIEYLLTKNIEE